MLHIDPTRQIWSYATNLKSVATATPVVMSGTMTLRHGIVLSMSTHDGRHGRPFSETDHLWRSITQLFPDFSTQIYPNHSLFKAIELAFELNESLIEKGPKSVIPDVLSHVGHMGITWYCFYVICWWLYKVQ